MLLDSLSFLCKLLCNGAAMGKMPAAAVTKDTAAGSDSSVNIRASVANVQYCFLYWSAKCLLIIRRCRKVSFCHKNIPQTEETGREKERRPAGFSSIYRNVQEQKICFAGVCVHPLQNQTLKMKMMKRGYPFETVERSDRFLYEYGWSASCKKR